MLMTGVQRVAPDVRTDPKNVLIIDADTSFADETAAALRDFGYETQTAENPQDGIARLATFAADVALLDTHIGAYDGIELIAALRECNPDILCILISGQSDTQSAIRALRFGAFDYLAKPIEIEILDAALDRCFDRLKLERDKAHAEHALAESEARFRAFFDNTPVVMSIKDMDSRYQMVNKPYQEWLGRPVDQLVGKSAHDVYADSSQANAFNSLDRAVIESGKVQESEIKVARQDGAIRELATIKFPIKLGDGDISAIGTVGIDITERKESERAHAQSEELLRSFIDNSDATMNMKDLDGRYLLVNETFRRLQKNETALGKTYSDIGDEADAANMDAVERRVIETGKIQRGADLVEYPNGETWYRRYTKFPVSDAEGNLLGVGGIGTDIMGIVRVENQLRETEARLRAIIDNYPSMISLKDSEGRYLVVNQAFADVQGISIDDAAGKTIDELETPEPQDIVKAHDSEAIALGCPVTREHVWPDTEGRTTRHAVTKFPALDANGRLMGVGTICLDVTERRHAEDALRENEKLLRSILDSIPSPISLKGLDRKFILVNKAFEEVLGLNAEQVVGRTAEILWHESEASRIEAHEQSVIDTGITRTDERSNVLLDGNPIHSIATKFPIFDTDGNVKLIGTILTDISERRAAEEAVRKSEQQLRLIIDSLPIAISYISADERYVLTNKTSARWNATTPENLTGRFLEEVQQTTFPNLRERIDRPLNGEECTFETAALYPDGVTRDIQITNVPDFDPDGSVRGFFGMAQDITARKQGERQHRETEERFRAVIDYSPAAIFVKDLDGRYLMINRTFRKWLNIDEDADYLGKTAHDYFASETAERIDAHERLIAFIGKSSVQEREVVCPDGVTRQTWSHKFPISDTDGNCTAVGTVVLDVTEQRCLQAQLSQAQKMEAVGQLTGGIAHDFNNLLGVIVGNLDFLSEELRDNPDLFGMVEPVMRAALSGANLTRQLLAFSRKQPLAPQVIDLNQHVSDMTDMLRRTLGESIVIKMNLDGHPRTTEVDPAQLETVLLNLAVNARDAMPDGGELTIETSKMVLDDAYVALHAEVEAGDYAMLSVTDTGTGMSKEILNQAFDPFFTTKGVGEGSGLGLSMVFGFTKQSGGHVEIESEVGTGTTVKLYLPYVEKTVPLDPQLLQDVPAAQGEKVLVVEDDPELLILAVTLLDSLGYSVVEAKNATVALQLLEETSDIDALLTDIVMPGPMNGLALAEKTKETYPDIKILFMSGYASEAVEIAGCDEKDLLLLHKPFRIQELASMMRVALDG